MSSPRSKNALFACLVLALSIGPSELRARVTGEIRGRVSDERGAALPGIAVRVDNRETGAARSTVTGSRGTWGVRAIPSGSYTVSASRDGFRTSVAREIRLLVGQVLEVDLTLPDGEAGAWSSAGAGTPAIETARPSSAAYVGERAIAGLLVAGRDFTDLALLAPSVERDTEHGFLTLSGQRAIYSGLAIDGTDAKSAFFAYGRGGEAAANDGPPVALDSVRELQVVVGGLAPEHGGSGGGYVNVVTRGGTNDLEGGAFFYTRDEAWKSDLERSPLERFAGRTDPLAPGGFGRDSYGASLGGPLARDRTHFFAVFDKTLRDEPFSRSLDARGLYDAILERARIDPRFLALLDGFAPRLDGAAAPDPFAGRTAAGLFHRDVDNRVLFGRIDHRIDDALTLAGRLNLSDYERTSSFADEESQKRENTLSLVLENVALIGPDKVVESRVQIAEDDLDRSSTRVGQGIAAEIEYLARGEDVGNSPASLGKLDFLPVVVEESKLEIRSGFSYLLGRHDLRVGLDYQRDELQHLRAEGRDGVYGFDTLEDFIANRAGSVEIFFGDVTFPTYDRTQEVYGLYAQDVWRPGAGLSLHYGVRFGGTRNPDGLPHLFPAGRGIPDDTDNIAPRVGFAWRPDAAGRSVVRGAAGLYFGRTPAVIFASQAQQNGLFPNAGRVGVGPGDVGFVPLGEAIDNQSPPPGIAVATGFVDPGFEDAETLRLSLGYERALARDWSLGVDLVWADGEKLLENVDINRAFSLDATGRPIFSPERPLTRGDVTGQPDGTPLAEVLTRQSIGESEYRAATVGVRKRFSGRYQLQAHYTWAEDRDTSSNERSADDVTVLRPDDVRFDFGFSDRDVRHRLVLSGLVELPLGFTLGGVYEYRGGRPFNPVDRADDLVYCGFDALGGNCPDVRPVVDGRVLERNSFRNESLDRLDLRIGKFFELAGRYRFDVFLEVFNAFDEQAFEVDDSAAGDRQRDPGDEQFGLASVRVLDSREMQIGVRFRF